MFPLVALAIVFIILFLILIFSSKRLSPVPYFPTNRNDLPLIIKVLGLAPRNTVVDLGAGDGIVVFEAAKVAMRRRLDTRFIAVEINPILTLILHLRRLFHQNRKNIRIIWGDFFKLDFNQLPCQLANKVTFYLYISPWFLDRVSKRIRSQIQHAKIVSYMYPIGSLRNREKKTEGLHTIFRYG